MAILVYAEHAAGTLAKGSFEAVGFATRLAETLGGQEVHALVLGELPQNELEKLAKFGAQTVHHLSDAAYTTFNSMAHAAAVVAAAEQLGAHAVIAPQSYNGRAIAPRVAVKYAAALLSGVDHFPEKTADGWQVKRTVYSNKGVQTLSSKGEKVVITTRANAFPPEEKGIALNVQPFSFDGSELLGKEKVVKQDVITDEIPLTEADVVVSAGRGLKGPENWGMIEDLAKELGAATACSKPVSDVDWRPHHEHVGQTGIQIAPNVYIAVGISGAIQHLAGVSASKTIIVINKDPEAPFFKAADYGVVGDAFEVVPKLLEEVKAYKAANA